MHETLKHKLHKVTLLLHFYGHLTRGVFTENQWQESYDLLLKNDEKLKLMSSIELWDGNYETVYKLILKTEDFIELSKEKIQYKQICNDDEIAKYIISHPDFFDIGIELKDLKLLLDIENLFQNGHFLHDVYLGYPEDYCVNFQIDCLDYLNSAIHYYNEAYDLYYKRKYIKNYTEIDRSTIPSSEQKRIHSETEVIYRNFREAFINLIFFGESFINSVGFDAFLNSIATSEIEELALKGISNKNYLTIAKKLKQFSKIINGTSIDIGTEPFKTYLEQYIDIRNQYVHSSPEKGKMRLSINDWKKKCDELIDLKCIEFLNAFWKSCYPNKNFPKIIFNSFYTNSFKGRHGKMYQLK
jgi:hypothetical protein